MRRKESGFTLAEVLIGMILMALIVMTVFSVVVSTRVQQSISDREQVAALYAERLRETLRNYMVPVTDIGAIPMGPQIAGDACGAWAFSMGCWHNANSLLPAWFSGAPYSGRMCYQVTAAGTGFVPDPFTVQIRVEWRELDQTPAVYVNCPP